MENLTKNDEEFLTKREVDESKWAKYDRLIGHLLRHSKVLLSDYTRQTGDHFSKQEIGEFRFLASRHSFGMKTVNDYIIYIVGL